MGEVQPPCHDCCQASPQSDQSFRPITSFISSGSTSRRRVKRWISLENKAARQFGGPPSFLTHHICEVISYIMLYIYIYIPAYPIVPPSWLLFYPPHQPHGWNILKHPQKSSGPVPPPFPVERLPSNSTDGAAAPGAAKRPSAWRPSNPGAARWGWEDPWRSSLVKTKIVGWVEIC